MQPTLSAFETKTRLQVSGRAALLCPSVIAFLRISLGIYPAQLCQLHASVDQGSLRVTWFGITIHPVHGFQGG